MSFSCPYTLQSIDPRGLDGFFESLADLRFGIDDPYSVMGVERNGEEYWFLYSSANELGVRLEHKRTGSGSPRRKISVSLPESIYCKRGRPIGRRMVIPLADVRKEEVKL